MRKDLSDLHNLLTEAEKFVFDEKDYDLIYLAEPLKGKDVL